MGGKSSSQQQSQTVSQPWGPTQQPLTDLVNNVVANNATLPDYSPQTAGLANNLLSNQPNYNQNAQDYYNTYAQGLSPFTNANYLDPMSNPYLGTAMQTLNSDITNQINDMFAANGRQDSGLNQQALARGLSQGEAQLLMNQYNTNANNYLGAQSSLYGAGNATNQGILGNALTGLNTANNIPGMVNNTAATEQLLLPIAGLGGQTNSSGTSTTTQPLSQTWAQWMSPFKFSWGA